MGVRESLLAVVTSNRDPEQKHRVRVKCPDLSGQHELPDWLVPSPPYGGPNGAATGAFFVPAVGSTVELELEPDEEGLVIGEGSGLPRARYRATLLALERVPAPFRPTVQGTDCYPNVAGWMFPDGSYLSFNFDPATGGGRVTLFGADLRLGGDADSATEQLVLGTSGWSALQTLLNAVSTFSGQVSAAGGTLSTAGANPVLAALASSAAASIATSGATLTAAALALSTALSTFLAGNYLSTTSRTK